MERLTSWDQTTGRTVARTAVTRSSIPLWALFFKDGSFIVISAYGDNLSASPEVYRANLENRELLELGIIDDQEYVRREEIAAGEREQDLTRRDLADLARLKERYEGAKEGLDHAS